MYDFSFVAQVPYRASTVVLFMHEPLWALSQVAAHVIYKRMLGNARRFAAEQHKRVIVAYFQAGGDALPALREHNAQLLAAFDYDTLNFCYSCKCCVYELL